MTNQQVLIMRDMREVVQGMGWGGGPGNGVGRWSREWGGEIREMVQGVGWGDGPGTKSVPNGPTNQPTCRKTDVCCTSPMFPGPPPLSGGNNRI